jgi:hypothetical protein
MDGKDPDPGSNRRDSNYDASTDNLRSYFFGLTEAGYRLDWNHEHAKFKPDADSKDSPDEPSHSPGKPRKLTRDPGGHVFGESLSGPKSGSDLHKRVQA